MSMNTLKMSTAGICKSSAMPSLRRSRMRWSSRKIRLQAKVVVPSVRPKMAASV